MRNIFNILFIVSFSLLPGFLMFSCVELDENNEGAYSELKINLTAAASSGDLEDAVYVGGLQIDDFEIALSDLSVSYLSEAGINAGMDRMESFAFNDQNVKSDGSLKLVEDGKPRSNLLGKENTPNGLYQEVAFHLEKTSSANTSHSLKLEGIFEGKEVMLWTGNEDWLKAKATNTHAYTIYSNSVLTLVFEVEKLFENIEISSAKDGNNDGLIEIGPNNEDGNHTIFLAFEQNLQKALQLRK
ncbi:hypothetical protein [Echinicola salinicaeni]|uniref:hypothetical protein n=1 Tax=Echinicola salinicaeni TaxID=2762757 RepID=UPI001646B57D|nr:hypothetical protein [Echinicola salinicaeni]